MAERAGGRPILVTGSHRSGTTWIGKMLALAPEVGYIHEPFSPATPRGISGAPFPTFYTYVTDENEHLYAAHLDRTVRFAYNWGPQLASIRTPRQALHTVSDAAAFLRSRVRGSRPLLKDPIALFSAEWLARRYDMEVVVVIRHPAAFVSSVKRLGWGYHFRTWLEDDRLMRDHLAPFAGEIAEYAQTKHTLVEQGALLWRIVYSTVDGFRERHPEWIFVRHEDISRDPVGEFASVYTRLDISFSDRIEKLIEKKSASTNPVEPQSAHSIQLDSRANLSSWRRRLTTEEVETIRTAVADVSRRFYGDDEW
jgi:sulfotransferase family protein